MIRERELGGEGGEAKVEEGRSERGGGVRILSERANFEEIWAA